MRAKYCALLLITVTFIPASCFLTASPEPPPVLTREQKQKMKWEAWPMGTVDVNVPHLSGTRQTSKKESQIEDTPNADILSFMPADSKLRILILPSSQSENSDQSNDEGGGDNGRQMKRFDLNSIQRGRGRGRGASGRGASGGAGRGSGESSKTSHTNSGGRGGHHEKDRKKHHK